MRELGYVGRYQTGANIEAGFAHARRIRLKLYGAAVRVAGRPEHAAVVGDTFTDGVQDCSNVILALRIAGLRELTERIHGDEYNRREDRQHTDHDEDLDEREASRVPREHLLIVVEHRNMVMDKHEYVMAAYSCQR